MNIAIVGCGFIAKKHATAIENIEGARLVAVCDRVPELMDYYVENYNVKAYTDLDEMLKDESIDIVNICTPSGTHAFISEKVANAKKHIVLEKPIAMTITESMAINKAVKINGVKLAVVHPNRFRPAAKLLKDILNRNLLGKISHGLCIVNWNRGQEYYNQAVWRGTKEHDGGVLMNQAIHNLDLLLWYLGKPKEVFSMDATRLRDIESEDVSTGLIRFETGVIATVQASTTVYPKNLEESITIFGEKGVVKIGGTNAVYLEHIEIEGVSSSTLAEWKRDINENPWGIPGHQKIIEDIIHAIKENREPEISGDDGQNALSLVLDFYKSAESNRPVQWSKRNGENVN